MIRTKKTPIMWWSPQSRWWWCMDGGNSWGLPLSVGRSAWWSVVIDQLLMSTQELCTQRTMCTRNMYIHVVLLLLLASFFMLLLISYWWARRNSAVYTKRTPELFTCGCDVVVVVITNSIHISLHLLFFRTTYIEARFTPLNPSDVKRVKPQHQWDRALGQQGK